ncbi:Cysteine protease atg4 [Agyrium rufum]|nr:Cysteine protease atg4 [Agyrium rufum]
MANVDLNHYKRMVQYFWDPEPKNDVDTDLPIWCLGKRYTNQEPSASTLNDSTPLTSTLSNGFVDIQQTPEAQNPEKCTQNGKKQLGRKDSSNHWPAPFLEDFDSRFWFTYRSGFAPIPKSTTASANAAMTFSVRLRSQLIDTDGFTSDTGWGCMIRSGQSLLANSLALVRFGRQWRRGSKTIEEQRLIAQFADDPRAPFSIHRFVQHGASACGKHPGEWFGPSATAQCIKALSQDTTPDELRIYLTGDGPDIYEDALFKLAKTGAQFHPTLLLIGVRLGIDRVNPVYWNALRSSLELSQSVGIAGGRPSASHYFIACQGEHLFYLDPHSTRPCIPYHSEPSDYLEEEAATYHTSRIRRLHLRDMDPSMLLAFLIRDEQDWKAWRRALSRIDGKAFIHVADCEPQASSHSLERPSAIEEVEAIDDDETGLDWCETADDESFVQCEREQPRTEGQDPYAMS